MTQNEKIVSLEKLAELTHDYRKYNKKIVHCHGVFDLLHIGHIRYFEQARRMGDILIVTLTSDEHVDKGPHRPAFTEDLRLEAVASLKCVDYVALNKWSTAEETLRMLLPDVYVKGSEFKNLNDTTGKIAQEETVVQEIGAELAFTEDIVFSSSNLINKYLSNLPEEMNKYLDLFRSRFSLDSVLEILDKMRSLNVLVIGDTILDEYQYCETIGKSSKDPTLAIKYQSHDLFAGGVLAVANHVANFAGSVTVATLLGEKDSHKEFIESQLHSNVTPMFFVQPGAPTLVKRRFIDSYSFNKLLEVYIMDDSGLPPDRDREMCTRVADELSNYDLVIAADFGHGAISDRMLDVLMESANYLAVNTQANAGNRGFHTITKYPQADYICIAEHELRLEARAKEGDVRPMLLDISKKLGCSRCVVTRGRSGCAVCDGDGGFLQVPSFATKIVDRVGAGDAFLSVTSLAAVQGVPSEMLGFLGNVVGALAVEIIGNKKAIDRKSVQKYITALMK